MRVVMLLGRSTGGIGTHVAQLSADLRARGVDVIVVTHPLTAARFDLGSVRLLWPGSVGSGGSAGLVQALRDFLQLRSLASTADIVHAHGHQGGLLATLATVGLRGRWRTGEPGHSRGHQGGLLAILATVGLRAMRRGGARGDRGDRGPRPAQPSRRGSRRRVPMGRVPLGRVPRVIVSQHNAVLDDSRRQLLKRLSQRWVARRADLVTGASSDLVKEALAFGAGRSELAEVPSPRVPELLAEPPADAAARGRTRHTLLSSLSSLSCLTRGQEQVGYAGPLVVTISRIAPQKNLPDLVQAASLLRQSCTWVVIGDGDQQLLAQLRRQASSLAAPVHFIGPRSDIDVWLRAAEVFVLPSEWEARALVVQEAMAAGTPVVATDVGGLHDLVAGTGLLVPRSAPEAIATAVDRLLIDPALREELAACGRERARGLPDGLDTAARWLAWYSETPSMT